MKLTDFPTLVFCSLGIACLVQSNTLFAEQAKDESTFTVNYRVYGLHPGNYKNIRGHDVSSESTPIEFRPKARSETYRASLNKENPILTFTRRSRKVDQNSEPVDQTIASAAVKPGSRQILIVFTQTKNGQKESNYKAIAIDDSSIAFPASSLRILNLTGMEIIGLLDSKQVELENYACSAFKKNSNKIGIRISIATEGSTRHHLLYRNTLQIDPRERALLILRGPTRKGSLRIGGNVLYQNLKTNF